LIEDHQVPLIATYTATLSPDLQVETYAYFLEGKKMFNKQVKDK